MFDFRPGNVSYDSEMIHKAGFMFLIFRTLCITCPLTF